MVLRAFILRINLSLSKVVGVLSRAGKNNKGKNNDNKSDNSDGNNNDNNNEGDNNHYEEKSDDGTDCNSNADSDVGSDSFDGSAGNDVTPGYNFNGRLDAKAISGSGKEVAVKATLTGPAFIAPKDFRKLQDRGDFQASVDGFAVLTRMRDACFGPHQAKADLLFSAHGRNKESRILFMYQGHMWLELGELDVNGGDNMVRLKGDITLKFDMDVPSRRRREDGVGVTPYDYTSCMIYKIM